MKKVNPIIQWWVTSKLPVEDVFASHNFFSQWVIHPIKRRLARWYLKLLQNFTNIKVIAVTGSSGKTTTIQMLAGILKLSGKTIWSREGVDSVYNIPNTILRTMWGTKYLILEMSVEYIGEMDFYLWLAKPDIAVITNIFPTHTLFFGNVEGVANEKSKIIKNLSKTDFVVLNHSNKFTNQMSKFTKAQVVWFDEKDDPVLSNMEVAKKVAEVVGVNEENIQKGLNNYQRPKHRFNIFDHKSGALIFDDTYNSNPEAVISSLKTFMKVAEKYKKIAVLGDMLELGKIEESEHGRVGRKIKELNFNVVIGVGKLTKFLIDELDSVKTKVWLVKDSDEVVPILSPLLDEKVAVFVKGSRSIRLDKVISNLS